MTASPSRKQEYMSVHQAISSIVTSRSSSTETHLRFKPLVLGLDLEDFESSTACTTPDYSPPASPVPFARRPAASVLLMSVELEPPALLTINPTDASRLVLVADVDHDTSTSIQLSNAFSSTQKSNSNQRPRRRRVTFSEVQIRRYPMILGDNPACRIGAPVSIGWDYEALPSLSLNDYEAFRQTHPRRKRLNQLILSYYRRLEILQRLGTTPAELKHAEKQAARIQFQRSITAAFAPFQAVERMAESAGRKVRRKIRRRQNAGIKEEEEEEEDKKESRCRSFQDDDSCSEDRKLQPRRRLVLRRHNNCSVRDESSVDSKKEEQCQGENSTTVRKEQRRGLFHSFLRQAIEVDDS